MTSPFIIHSMGKCGSRSVATSLLTKHFMVMHAHRLAHPADMVEVATASTVDQLWRKRVHMNVLVLTRMPVQRNVSAYFENLQSRTAATVEHFVNTYKHSIPSVWFETELKEFWGLDVFASEFDKDRGWQSYQRTDSNITVVRLENLNTVWNEVQREFLFPTPVPLQRFGTNNSKEYAEFKTKHLPEDYIEAMHSTIYANHFYTEGELRDDRY